VNEKKGTGGKCKVEARVIAKPSGSARHIERSSWNGGGPGDSKFLKGKRKNEPHHLGKGRIKIWLEFDPPQKTCREGSNLIIKKRETGP